MSKTTILLAEDHTVFRECFRRMLELEDSFEVICEAQHGREAVALAKQLRPALVLMDISMPLLNGLEATRQIRKECPGTKVVILSAHKDDLYIQNAAECGAQGFVFKETSFSKIRRVLQEVQNGNVYFSSTSGDYSAPANGKSSPGSKTPGERLGRLTARESEVLQLIAEGKANKQTAQELGISSKTVEKHRYNLMSKLKIHDTASLTRHAMEIGLIETPVPVEMA
jgi:DNA-binding NarL/FixJ family response regulator